jgi:hypothetical protein
MSKQKQQPEQQPTLDRVQQQPAAQQPPEDQEETPRMSRNEAALAVVKGITGETTLEELAQAADVLYIDGRGGDAKHSDIDKGTWAVHAVLETAQGLGVLELQERWEIKVRPVRKA